VVGSPHSNMACQRCMKDLRERFAKINIDRSPPIVPFRETLMSGTEEGTSPANALSPDGGDMGLGTQTQGARDDSG